MKKLQQFLNCATQLIRKKFFNGSKNDIYQECNGMPVFSSLVEENNENETREYLENYMATTRWQTL